MNDSVQSGLILQDNVSYVLLVASAVGVRISEWMAWQIRIKIVLLHLALIILRPKKRYNYGMWPCNKAVLPCPKTLLNMWKHNNYSITGKLFKSIGKYS